MFVLNVDFLEERREFTPMFLMLLLMMLVVFGMDVTSAAATSRFGSCSRVGVMLDVRAGSVSEVACASASSGMTAGENLSEIYGH